MYLVLFSTKNALLKYEHWKIIKGTFINPVLYDKHITNGSCKAHMPNQMGRDNSGN